MNPSEVLFFTFMVSAIALGDVFEMVADSGWRISLAIFFSALLFGAVWSIVLYAMNIAREFGKPDGLEAGSNLLLYSQGLAGFFLLLGTIVQVVSGRLEGGRSWRRRW